MDSEMDVEIDCEASEENILVDDELDTDKLVLTARIDPDIPPPADGKLCSE